MKEQLIDCLACPECQSGLSVKNAAAVFELHGQRHLVDGILQCQRSHDFPVIDEVPRLLPHSHLTLEERDFLRRTVPLPRHVTPVVVQQADVEADIRAGVETVYGLQGNSSQARRSLVAAEAAYLIAEYRGENKRKYVQLLERLNPSADSVLDIGGTLPGMLQCLSARFPVRRAVVADLNLRHALAFKTSSRHVALVRADAQCLPFRPHSFDLVVSAFLLEHVPDWRAALRSMVAVGKAQLIAFGPNRWFPFEIGHLDAPLAGTLPKPVASYVTYAWLKMRRRQPTLRRITEILDGMTYVSSRTFRKECRALHATTQNVFPELISLIAADEAAPRTRPRAVIRKWPRLSSTLARVLAAAGFEPQVYYFLKNEVGAVRAG